MKIIKWFKKLFESGGYVKQSRPTEIDLINKKFKRELIVFNNGEVLFVFVPVKDKNE